MHTKKKLDAPTISARIQRLLHFGCQAKHKHTGEHKKAVHKSRPIRSCQTLLSWPNISTCALFMLFSTFRREHGQMEKPPFLLPCRIPFMSVKHGGAVFPIACPGARFTDIKVINNESKEA